MPAPSSSLRCPRPGRSTTFTVSPPNHTFARGASAPALVRRHGRRIIPAPPAPIPPPLASHTHPASALLSLPLQRFCLPPMLHTPRRHFCPSHLPPWLCAAHPISAPRQDQWRSLRPPLCTPLAPSPQPSPDPSPPGTCTPPPQANLLTLSPSPCRANRRVTGLTDLRCSCSGGEEEERAHGSPA
jgi:hypothetical protein